MPQKSKEYHDSKLKTILYHSSSIAFIFIFVKIFGFFEKAVLAYYFGTSDEVDAYLVAYSIPFALFLIVEEIIGPVLVPFFVGKKCDFNGDSGSKLFKFFAYTLFFLFFCATLIGIYNSTWLVKYLAPGFSGEKYNLTVRLLENVFVVVFFLGFSSLITTIFHSYKKFNLPIFARLLEKLIIVLSIIFLNQNFGITSAIIGCVLGSIFRVLILIKYLPLQKKLKKPKIFLEQPIAKGELKGLIYLMMPLLFGILFSQLSSIVDNLVVSKLESGAISSLSYARKIIDLPVLIVPFSIGIVLLPFLSELNKYDKIHNFALLLENNIKILVGIFILITVLVLLFNHSIVQLLFERGNFKSNSTQISAMALFWFAFGLSAFAIEIPLMQSWFALKNTLTPILIGMFCATLNIVLTVFFVEYVGYIIVPIALSFQKTFKIILLLKFLKKKLPINIKNITTFSAKVITSGFVAYIIMSNIIGQLLILQTNSFIYLIMHLFIGSGLTIFLFLLNLVLLRVLKLTQIKKFFHKMHVKEMLVQFNLNIK